MMFEVQNGMVQTRKRVICQVQRCGCGRPGRRRPVKPIKQREETQVTAFLAYMKVLLAS